MRGFQSILLVLSLFLCEAAFPQASRLNAFEDYAEDNWRLTFGGFYTSRVIEHAETSTVPDYNSSGRRVRVPDAHYTFSLMREFMSSSTISVTAMGFAGFASSVGKSGGTNIDTLSETIHGNHFGGGLSFNYNLYRFGLKIQPYLGAQILSETGKMDLSHSSGSLSLNTINDYEAQLFHLGLGVRAFDADFGLMSYFEVSTPQVMSETYTPRAQVNGTNIAITSTSKITRDLVAFSLGFGFFF